MWKIHVKNGVWNFYGVLSHVKNACEKWGVNFLCCKSCENKCETSVNLFVFKPCENKCEKYPLKMPLFTYDKFFTNI